MTIVNLQCVTFISTNSASPWVTMENLFAVVQSKAIVWGMWGGIQFIYGCCWCCYSTCHVMHVWSFFYWPKCHMRIDVFEDSSNVQENLLKQWKYFPDQEGDLLQAFLFIMHFSFISCSPPVCMWWLQKLYWLLMSSSKEVHTGWNWIFCNATKTQKSGGGI